MTTTRRWTSYVVPAVLLAAVGAVVVGWAAPPRPVADTMPSQVLGLARVGLAVVAAAALLLGPGLVLRGRRRHDQVLRLGFVPLPGIALLAVLGLLVWVLADRVDPVALSRGGVLLILAVVLVGSRISPSPITAEEGRVLGVAGAVFTAALGRALWSPGPEGELYAGTISRTLEVGDRSDARISYHVVSLITHGFGPASDRSVTLFTPYSFSDRGPVPGLVTSPLTLALGTHPTGSFPDQPWSIFDPRGFMVYRIVLMLLAVCAVLAVHTVARQAFGSRVAWLAVLVVAGTPFVVHDVYFTWPKLAAAAMCLLSATMVLQHRYPGAGLLVGVGYLMHPLALLSVPTLGLLTLIVSWRRGALAETARTVVRRGAALAGGLAVVLLGWRLVNGSHYSQSSFLDYFTLGDNQPVAGPGEWLDSRARSLLNTFVPLRLPLVESDNPSINAVFTGPSDAVVHFFFQYWTGLAFGGALLFYPVLVWGLLRVGRTRPAVVALLVVVPLLVFAIYWGSFASGLMREGLHTWVLTVLVLWSSAFANRLVDGRGLPRWLRVVLVLRLVEVAAMITVPSVHAVGSLTQPDHRVGDLAALALMALGLGVIGALTWQVGRPGTAPVSASRPARRSRRTAA